MPYPLFIGTVPRRLAQAARRPVSRAFFSTKPLETETFLTGSSSLYAEQMYDQYSEDPNSVHPSWKKYFDNLENGIAFSAEDFNRPTTIPGKRAAVVVSANSVGSWQVTDSMAMGKWVLICRFVLDPGRSSFGFLGDFSLNSFLSSERTFGCQIRSSGIV